MKIWARWNKTNLLFGVVAGWSLVFVSCVMVQRPIINPPMVLGAEFVGSQSCVECHAQISSSFHDATHARLMAEGDNAKDIGCESCHGPGSLHNQSGGELGTIVNPRGNPETCFQCHLDKRGEFALPHAHPVGTDKLSCSDCHSAHSGDATMGGACNWPGPMTPVSNAMRLNAVPLSSNMKRPAKAA